MSSLKRVGPAYASAILAFASAAVSAYWTLRGTVLLDTVGGSIERLARERSGPAILLGMVVVLANAVNPSRPVDEHALRWHVYVWDLWFLVWGLALGLAAWRYKVNGRSS